jgi:Rhs element Vgr protein
VANLKLKDGSGIKDVDIQEWANAKRLFNQLAKIRGRVKFQGIPDVKPNTTLVLEGVGERFNGKVYVSAVRHQISEGQWTVDAQFGMDPDWFSEKVKMNDLPASGLVAAAHGLQIAKVTQLEDDPDGEDRIQVRLPVIDDSEVGVWARIATLDAGENRGTFFRPELDDEVVVGFLNGNPNHPVIVGMLNSSAKPAPIVATDDNHVKGIVTRSEMKLMFDDDKKIITIETPAGNKITLDEDDTKIELEDQNGNKLTMNSDGIALESPGDINITATGDVNIEGTNVSVKANAQLSAEGSAGAELKSSATAVIQGSIVQIN